MTAPGEGLRGFTTWWAARGTWLRWLLLFALTLAAAQRLGDGFHHLLWDPSDPIDLHFRHAEVTEWFAGEPLYTNRTPVYPPASLALLWPLLGWLSFGEARYRHADLWVRLGLCALVARFWTFHYRYDDLLIVVPLIALVRLAAGGGSSLRGARLTAAVALALTCASLLAPARLLFAPWPASALFEAGQTVVWLGCLAFLACCARAEAQAAGRTGAMTLGRA